MYDYTYIDIDYYVFNWIVSLSLYFVVFYYHVVILYFNMTY